MRAIKKRKKWNKKFNIFRVIIIVSNNYFIILKLSRAIKGYILYQVKQTAFKSDYKIILFVKLTDTCWIEELQTRKSLSPIWASSSLSRKRQTTDFEPLRHKYVRFVCCTYNTLFPDDGHAILDAIHSVRYLSEVIFSKSLLISVKRTIVRSGQVKVTSTKDPLVKRFGLHYLKLVNAYCRRDLIIWQVIKVENLTSLSN